MTPWEWQGAQVSPVAVAPPVTPEGRAAASSSVGAAGGGEPQGSLRVPRTGAGEHKSALDLILSLLRTGWKASNTQKTPMVYAREVYQPQSPAMC